MTEEELKQLAEYLSVRLPSFCHIVNYDWDQEVYVKTEDIEILLREYD